MAVLKFNAFVEESLFQLVVSFSACLERLRPIQLIVPLPSSAQHNSTAYASIIQALSSRSRLNRTNLSSTLSACRMERRELHHSPTFLKETHNGSYDQMRPSSMPCDRAINAIMRNNGDVWHVYCDAPPLLPEPLRRTAERT